ncbi:MAG: FkbM family methyltransferase, partial [Acetobacteraceae bacterium]|nr:FkbM family methyltransferase [Acetobacteraceae bacterium]
PAAAAAAPLIFDLGVNDGTDTDYYLRKGYRVVGVEAAPDLVAHLHRRFPAEIADGRFVLLDRVLWQQAGLKIPFHVNLDNNEWSSFDPAIAGRDPSHRVVTHEIESTTYEELVTRFGLPRYIKCDIEGGDVIFCEQLSRSPHRPAFVSAELGRKGTVGLMAQAGYDRFQIVNQGIIPGTRAPAGTREGREVDMTFAHTSSGAFGLDLPADRWLDLEDTIAVLNAFTVVWQKAGHLCAAWADVHATRAEHLG